MYRKEMTDRSPMRVFEQSMHSGLGRGRIGVVAAGPGVGKTPLLVQIAIDNLLRERRVLHISYEHAVDHVRAFYNEIFHDLAEAAKLSAAEAVQLDLERHRLLFSLRAQFAEGPLSQRGGRSSISKMLEVVTFTREVAHFEPDVIIIDGFDFGASTEEALVVLRALARERGIELWISTHSTAPAAQPDQIPAPFDRCAQLFDVLVLLCPTQDSVRLRLRAGSEHRSLSDPHLRLDPHTMRVLEEDLAPAADRPRDPRSFRLISGGSKGAEAEFGRCAERWGVAETNYSYEGHRSRERNRGLIVLADEELQQSDFSLGYVSRRLSRGLSQIPLIRRVLQTIWHQIIHARQVFAVGTIQTDGTLRGGTGWGAELARIWKKPLFAFDQTTTVWFRWNGRNWEPTERPVITSEVFAGIGTQNLTPEGQAAIENLFRRSFGDPLPKSMHQ